MVSKNRSIRLTRMSVSSAVVVVWMLVASSCALMPTVGSQRPATPTNVEHVPCGDSWNSCAMPFPSKTWQVADEASDSGYSFDLPTGAVREQMLSQLGRNADFEAVFGSANGYSAATPIYFQFPVEIDVESIPSDGGAIVAVYDASSGQQIPVRVERSAIGTDSNDNYGILEIWPVTRFEFGHEIVAVVRSGLRNEEGYALPRTRMVPGGISDAKASAFLSDLEASTDRLDPQTSFDDYVAATSFVVRTQRDVTDQTDEMVRITREAEHPVRGIRTSPALGFDGVVVNGQLQITEFRDEEWTIAHTGPVEGRPRWTDFMLTIPNRGATAQGAPVIVYGHGVAVTKETMMLSAVQSANKGVATIAIDIPLHGSRQDEGGKILDLAHPSTFGRISAMIAQGAVDQVSLVEAILNHLDELDVAPYNMFFGSKPDGKPDLDTSQLWFLGTSLGGIYGLPAISMIPEFDGVHLQVAGCGVIDIISHSWVWDLFRTTLPAGADIGEQMALIGGGQQATDMGEASYYLDRIIENGTPMYFVYTPQDGVVIEPTAERAIAGLRIPVRGTVEVPLRSEAIAEQRIGASDPRFGVLQLHEEIIEPNLITPLLTHTMFLNKESVDAFGDWIDNMLDAA